MILHLLLMSFSKQAYRARAYFKTIGHQKLERWLSEVLGVQA